MKLNTQSSKPRDTGIRIPIMESFDTLQGEGFHVGKPAYFIRTGGCDVGCHWCDVKESWEAEKHKASSVREILDDLDRSPAEIVVITGGEPLMYDLDILTSAIKEKGKRTHVETSGCYGLTGNWDWICFSPKKFKPPLTEYYESHELKVIIYNQSDFEWAEKFAEKMNPASKLFLQPEWSKRHQMLPLIVGYVKKNPKWRVSLQTHKYMDIP